MNEFNQKCENSYAKLYEFKLNHIKNSIYNSAKRHASRKT